MNNTLKRCFALLGAVAMHSAIAASVPGQPGWSYPDADAPGGQSSWSLIADPTSQAPAPLNYPYAECGIGTKQSPIDVKSADIAARAGLSNINFRYNPEPLAIVNNGHTILVQENTVAPGKLYFGTVQSYDEYTLLQFHLHAPSEHTLDGVSFPMEMHFVHATPDGKMAVVGVIVVAGAYNTELQKILDNAPTSADNITYTPPVSVNPNHLLPDNTSAYVSYAGSLTTPPCTQGVNWYVLTNFIEASEEQIVAFEALFHHHNARTTNKLNGRLVNFKP